MSRTIKDMVIEDEIVDLTNLYCTINLMCRGDITTEEKEFLADRIQSQINYCSREMERLTGILSKERLVIEERKNNGIR